MVLPLPHQASIKTTRRTPTMSGFMTFKMTRTLHHITPTLVMLVLGRVRRRHLLLRRNHHLLLLRNLDQAHLHRRVLLIIVRYHRGPSQSSPSANNPQAQRGPLPSAPDTQPPSVPGNVTTNVTNANIELSWDASSDNGGVVSYTVERSTDQQNWQQISDSPATSYSNVDVIYNTQYYYRVAAKDGAGNRSDYAYANAVSSSFSPNVTKGNELSLQSDDNVVTAKVSSDATGGDAFCVIKTYPNKNALPDKKSLILLGPYNFYCKNASGDILEKFNSLITAKAAVPANKRKGFTKFGLIQFDKDNNVWKVANVKFDAKSNSFTMTTDSQLKLALTAVKKGNLGPIILIVFLVLVGLGVVAFIYINKNYTINWPWNQQY